MIRRRSQKTRKRRMMNNRKLLGEMILKRSSRLSSVSLAPYRAPFVPPYKPREVWFKGLLGVVIFMMYSS